MIDTYKFRLYPTNDQKKLLRKHFDCVRFIYNWALNYNKMLYSTQKLHKTSIDLCCDGSLKKLKKCNPWLNEVNAQSLIASIAHLDRAFSNFFNGSSSFPKFKKKNHTKRSFEIPQSFHIDFKKSSIQIPKFCKFNKIKVRIHREINLENFIKYGKATITEDNVGHFYVSFIVHRDDEKLNVDNCCDINENNSIGFDFGLKHFLTLSDGRIIDSPFFLSKSLEKLRKIQRKYDKKRKNNKNTKKQRKKIAKLHLKILNQRNDFLHKLSTKLVKENQFDCFCFEDLDINHMKSSWGRKISDLSFMKFQTMMSYKCKKIGKKFKKIGKYEPSTQICHVCGHRQEMPLDVRVYECPSCGLCMDRDLNAAINIRNFSIRNTDGMSEIYACGV